MKERLAKEDGTPEAWPKVAIIVLDEGFGGLLDCGKELDRHYIGSRYPSFYPSGAPYKFYTEEVARTCLSYAESILSEVKRYLRR